MLNVTLTDSQYVLVTVSGAVDRKGNPAPLDGPPSFVSADASIVSVRPDPAGDPNSAQLWSEGPLSAATIVTVTADARLGPDVVLITDNIAVEITAGDATGFALTAGTPTEQP